ncbi:hypothetical protein AMAG_20695 [Allomyces macrogynus ATCC 38327]|uniref:Uncharacterized protein n=1 Tax=Allomyces macrogynus (strain ATCC 38327) TaxID=578462 RepID=A0A0L0TF06_ALLM3|nr:hypothetical protein AMAG_20695 [Allomyces macrogynus ATCC 38327]|eukprot:KNE73169.1 hypothetical protein AMAG_20695 [Allomyces macrogynus ATCC 38327]
MTDNAPAPASASATHPHDDAVVNTKLQQFLDYYHSCLVENVFARVADPTVLSPREKSAAKRGNCILTTTPPVVQAMVPASEAAAICVHVELASHGFVLLDLFQIDACDVARRDSDRASLLGRVFETMDSLLDTVGGDAHRATLHAAILAKLAEV